MLSNVMKLSNDTPLMVDPIGVAQMARFQMLFGQRSLFEGRSYSPYTLPRINLNISINSSEGLAHELYESLKRELKDIVVKNNNLGILLSGGMDSRIVAIALNDLQNELGTPFYIHGLTWGKDGCRDVEYAQRICKHYGWRHTSFPMSKETLWNNIYLAAELGAECNPVHLHAMDAVSQIQDVDIIIAGSYGDSIGRGEYSGVNVARIPNIHKTSTFDFHTLSIKKSALMMGVQHDIAEIRSSYNQYPSRVVKELDYHSNYLRRKLDQCMDIIAERIPVHQCFKTEGTYSLVLSSDYKFRNNLLYSIILESHADSFIKKIPWARTGLPYSNTKITCGLEDSLSKHFHDYGLWFRRDLYQQCKEIILSTNQLDAFFDRKSITSLLNINENLKQEYLSRIDEFLIWLTSFCLMLHLYPIAVPEISQLQSSSKLCKRIKSYATTYAYTILKQR